MQSNLTVLILAAGYGRRMGPFSRMINKGLVPYDNKPLISHIIEKFDEGTKFVIACGHMGQQVKDYVSAVHDDKHVVFVDIDNYAEGSTGPATSIQKCAEHISGGFLWVSCDTLFQFDYKDKLDHNWIAVHPVDGSIAQDYCWVEREADTITRVVNKQPSKIAVDAFIGLMYAKDDQYLDNLILRNAKETYQGFEGMDLKAHTVRDWKDFGTYEKWDEIRKDIADVSFPKPNELFYHDNNKIIKFWTDEQQAIRRLERASLADGMPSNIKVSGNFLVHDFSPGDIVYNQVTPELFRKMLDWCVTDLWKPVPTDGTETDTCWKFYFEKTSERVRQFRVKYSHWSEPCSINGTPVKSIDFYLNQVGFSMLASNHEWRFIHGDLHFDNTIYNPETDQFTAIDWRTDFAGKMYGDVYYDLAKMLGGIWLNYRDIKHERYQYDEFDNDIAYLSVPTVENAQQYEDILKEWVEQNKLDWTKVKMLVPIIYLNMSPLHEAPFDKFLIALAQLHFSRIL